MAQPSPSGQNGSMSAPELQLTGDDTADELLSSSPSALLIGMTLD